jgi:hypothetical protein
VLKFFTTVFVPGLAVTVLVTTPPPNVTVCNFVVVLTGSVVLTVDVTSIFFVIYTVCCTATIVCVVVFVLRLETVTALAVTVESEVFVTYLEMKSVLVDGLRVVGLPILDVEVMVARCVEPACATVSVSTVEVMVCVLVLPFSDVVLVAAIDVSVR